ncbi:MAG: heavy-metal-associated domain-containing protein [Chitinophagales bacterium]|nr:heavy-metal-associated domain-containing protein [Chitinophagales bacterium]
MKKVSTFLIVCFVTTLMFAGNLASINLSVKGMTCGGCENKFKEKALNIKGIKSVDAVSAETGTATVTFDMDEINSKEVIEALAENTGYTVANNTNGKETNQVAGKPSSCCQKGATNPACKKGETKKKSCDKKD